MDKIDKTDTLSATRTPTTTNSAFGVLKKFGVYELISKTGFIITLGICYRYRPVALFMQTQIGKNISGLYHKATNNIKLNMAHSVGKLPYSFFTSNFVVKKAKEMFYKIPQTLKLKSKRFAKATGEAIVITHLLTPVYAAIAIKIV